MADYQQYTQEAAITKATEIKTALALSKFRLVKGPFSLTAFTTRAELIAAEADFDGYVAGGYTLTAWTGPNNAEGGGAVITSPLVNPAYGPAGDPPVTNEIVAWWIDDAGGDVRVAGTYAPGRMMQQVGDGFPVVVQIVEGRNPPIVVVE